MNSVNRWIVPVVVLLVGAACQQPFGLGLPSERALENGAAGTLSATQGYEITGAYTVAGDRWTIDMQVQRSKGEHLVITSATGKLEALIIGQQAFFRGQQFLAQHLGTDPLSQTVVKAAGNSWWKGSTADVPQFADFTDGSVFKQTFLGSAVTHRTDGVSVDGTAAVELSGTRANVFIAAAPPNRLLRVQAKDRAVIDSVTDADLHYGNIDKDFGIAAPTDVIDFSNLSTLPPIYTVVSVDTSACGSPCVVSAQLKNLGGMTGAKAQSSVKFEMHDAATNAVLGSCVATVFNDVGYNSTTTASCTIGAQATNGANVLATVDNPGHA
jgi:hypothetical protein